MSLTEEQSVIELVKKFIEKQPNRSLKIDWDSIAKQIGTGITRQRCQKLWENYRARCDRKPFTKEEDDLLLQKVSELGPNWWVITNYFPDRRAGSLKRRYGKLAVQHMEQQPLPEPITEPILQPIPEPILAENVSQSVQTDIVPEPISIDLTSPMFWNPFSDI